MKITLFLLFCFNFLFADVILNDNQKIDNFSLHYFYDISKNLSIKEIVDKKFNQQTSNRFTFGYAKGNIWFKLTLHNSSKEDNFVFHLTEPFYDEVNFFEYKNDKWIKQKSGLFEYAKNGNKKDIYPTFFFTIKPNTTKTYYINLISSSVTFGEFQIYAQKITTIESRFNHFTFYTFYLGILFLVTIFSLFLYATLKDSIYFYYSGYVFSHTLFVFCFIGADLYILPPLWHNRLDISIPMFVIFFTLFSSQFLKLNFYLPKLDKFLHYYIFFTLLLIPFSLINYNPWIEIISEFVVVILILLIVASIYILIKGYSEAKYYIIALLIYIISINILSFMVDGVIKNTLFSYYSFFIGSLIETLVFYFVLANRFHKMQTEKIKIQNKLIETKKENEKVLEKRVEEKTSEIRDMNKKLSFLVKEKELLVRETNHRVKNNFQVIMSLLFLESDKKINQNYKNLLLELNNRIQSISLIHNYLLDSGNFSKIDSKEYFYKIINEIKILYEKYKINFHIDIDSYFLNSNYAMSLGIILNELLSNSIKHHPTKDNCKISISFKVSNSNATLIIRDNGSGFDIDKNYNGLGVQIIKQFSKKLQVSKMDFVNLQQGMQFTLKFKCN